jgi:trk system potassium uptake protein
MKFIVLGLGNFGRALAVRLTEMGHEVIGVDNKMLKVEQLKDEITHTICLNSTDRDAVSSLPLKDADAVIVAIGEDEAASLLTTALLKQLNVKRIIGRIVSDLQRTVLDAMAIKEYVLPEEEAAERLAMRLDLEEVIDSFKITEKYSIVEAVVPKRFIGMTIEKANFINAYNVLVLSLIKQYPEEGRNRVIKEAAGIATAQTIMEENDIMVLFGELLNIRSLLNL